MTLRGVFAMDDVFSYDKCLPWFIDPIRTHAVRSQLHHGVYSACQINGRTAVITYAQEVRTKIVKGGTVRPTIRFMERQ